MYNKKSQKSLKQGDEMTLFSYVKIFLDTMRRISEGGGKQKGQRRHWSEAIKLAQ